MKLGNLDIIGDPDKACGGIRLSIRNALNDNDAETFYLDSNQTEHLITYLKGLRDGLGWNLKAAADRSR